MYSAKMIALRANCFSRIFLLCTKSVKIIELQKVIIIDILLLLLVYFLTLQV